MSDDIEDCACCGGRVFTDLEIGIKLVAIGCYGVDVKCVACGGISRIIHSIDEDDIADWLREERRMNGRDSEVIRMIRSVLNGKEKQAKNL